MDALPYFEGEKCIFTLFWGIKSYPLPIFRDQIDALPYFEGSNRCFTLFLGIFSYPLPIFRDQMLSSPYFWGSNPWFPGKRVKASKPVPSNPASPKERKDETQDSVTYFFLNETVSTINYQILFYPLPIFWDKMDALPYWNSKDYLWLRVNCQ